MDFFSARNFPTMRGSFSFKTSNPNRYRYHDPKANQSHYIQITPIDDTIAAIEFFDNNFKNPIYPPLGFSVTKKSGPVSVKFGVFHVSWYDDYRVVHNGVEIIQLTNQKQISISRMNDAIVTNYE